MDNEQNLSKDAAAKARLKRKNVLREKCVSRQGSTSQTKQLCPQQRSRNRTPLSDITSSIFNQRN